MILFPASGVIKLSYEDRSINSDWSTEIPTSNSDTTGSDCPPADTRGHIMLCGYTLSIIILGKTGSYPIFLPFPVLLHTRTHTRTHTKMLTNGS